MGHSLLFNILNFNHPQEEQKFYFTDREQANLTRIYKDLVPKEVIEQFGEQDHYYTSFNKELEDFLQVIKPTTPVYETKTNKAGEEKSIPIANSAFSSSVLKRYYNSLIHNYFKEKGFLVKPNFVSDTEVWLTSETQDPSGQYKLFDRFSLKVQFKTVSNSLELLVTFESRSKIFKIPVSQMLEDVSPSVFNWVVYEKALYKFDELPEAGKRRYETVYPMWNFDIRDALRQETEAPDKSNKYRKFKTAIDKFYTQHLNTDDFKAIIPLSSNGFISVNKIKVGSVDSSSNRLLFGEEKCSIVPMNGMKDFGPFNLSPTSKIHFFYIFHKDDLDVAQKMDSFFKGTENGFKGLAKFIHTPYHTEKNFSIKFDNGDDPYPEIYEAITNKHFASDIQYIAIYLSPFSKNVADRARRKVYYKIKELLLKNKIPSQVIDADKVLTNDKYFYSLPNIAIAILAKLNGTPWKLDTKLKNELVVGVGAFRNAEVDVQYIGSAFSFANNGKFNRFEYFQKNQTEELAGSIMRAVKEYAAVNTSIKRLIIHFYKSMSQDELQPIEDGLKDLGLEIPVFIVSINKTESCDITAFDTAWKDLMPLSGTYINVGYNKFLLFNNTRYGGTTFNAHDGYPFPIKLKIYCTEKELVDDFKTVKELIDQVYQFSRMYWKSVRQQHLPVTVKYPEMIAEIVPHFEGSDISGFNENNLWFL